jgi:glycosyltransferase 2 family protein
MWLAIVIGLSVAVWMLYSNFSEEQFVKVEEGMGTHSLVKNKQDNKQHFILSGNGNYKKQRVNDVLKDIEWSSHVFIWLFLALIFVVGRDFFYMLRIRLLTHGELSWNASFWVIMLWEFASALSPGVVGGAAVAMFILNREKIPMGRSTAIVIVTAMLDNLFYVVMIPFVFLFIDSAQLFPGQTSGDRAVEYIFWFGFLAILSACTFLFTSIFLAPTLAKRFLGFIFSFPLLRKWRESAVRMGTDIEIASRELRKESFRYWVKVFAATCGSWISRYLVINAILQAFLHLGFIDHIIILGKQLVLWLFMLVSPTPGGSGVAEYAFGELLSSFSASGILLAGMAFLWRLISYFPYLFLGAYLLPRWIKRTSGN